MTRLGYRLLRRSPITDVDSSSGSLHPDGSPPNWGRPRTRSMATRDSPPGHVLPRFGDLPIGRINPESVAVWIGEMSHLGLSPSRIRQARLVLQGVLEIAVSSRELASNPCRDALVRRAEPKIPRKTLRLEDVLTEDEVRAIIGAVNERWQPLLLTLAYGGLRFGEAAGLRVEGVVVGRVHVGQAVSETSRGKLLGDVKDHEERFVELPQEAQRALLRAAGGADELLVFTTRRGGLLSVSSFHTQVWRRVLHTAQVPDRQMKSLRAFAASLWLDSGAPIEYVRDQLGHADLRTTQRYLETFTTRRNSIMNRLNERLSSPSDVGLVWGSTAHAADG